MNAILSVLDLLKDKIKSSVFCDCRLMDKVTEIRIRSEKPIIIYIDDRPMFISGKDELISEYLPDCHIVDKFVFNDIVNSFCNNSFHTNVETMKKGYIITNGGVRIGVSSKAVYIKGDLSSVRDISSLNIRFPHQFTNCSKDILDRICLQKNMPSIIVAAAPAMGKTTFLRDYARLVSSGYSGNFRKVTIIDERCEIATGFDVGINTDVISNFPKPSAIEMAIRSMSPEVIICDEIGNEDELDKIRSGFSSGVKFAVSVHSDLEDFTDEKSILNCLIKCGGFDYLIHLKHYTTEYEIYKLKDDNIENCRSSNNFDVLGVCGNIIQ